MQFSETTIPGVTVVDLEPIRDRRGHFARCFCADAFAARGLPTDFPQHSLSFNAVAGTVRGLHFQLPPHGEPKLIRCTRGAIFDVAVDLRPESPTWRQWVGIELSASTGRALYIPPGLAHGFQTLTDETEVLYMMGVRFVPEAARGYRWNDPAFGIDWPLPPTLISERDLSFPDFAGA
ncbi:dTDP-4-dehydrorhamnose 3,5-epimerase [Rhodospirillum centenum]|uniref:dTDP-4-dehydrorhamnose 3,5-epimerase n=1 Tax=Rhodospirillum centenum (strain ATCC 51521 / SW) TaxID=414684 RepID=B6IXU6_RHOCS|nr:dTDP-4-dehydrorhamnose 3,5-epimerase [Rhodospirillum centenum]ACJ01120.1 dTDP-4-dehydrorhamnose 3,5-epimerase, putative [Rhodospirillum centenum SW]